MSELLKSKHVLITGGSRSGKSGFAENPLFDIWHEWSLGVNITQVHSPALEAMLYHEAACLIRMAGQLEFQDSLALLREQAARLRASIESAWQPRTGLYHYRERGTGSARRRAIRRLWCAHNNARRT